MITQIINIEEIKLVTWSMDFQCFISLPFARPIWFTNSYSRTSTIDHSHLSTSYFLAWVIVHKLTRLNLFKTATTPQRQMPLKCVPYCQNNLSTTANFFSLWQKVKNDYELWSFNSRKCSTFLWQPFLEHTSAHVSQAQRQLRTLIFFTARLFLAWTCETQGASSTGFQWKS